MLNLHLTARFVFQMGLFLIFALQIGWSLSTFIITNKYVNATKKLGIEEVLTGVGIVEGSKRSFL